jgi:hypothetical protein
MHCNDDKTLAAGGSLTEATATPARLWEIQATD